MGSYVDCVGLHVSFWIRTFICLDMVRKKGTVFESLP